MRRFGRKACYEGGQREPAEDKWQKEQQKELPVKQLKERTESNEK
jgi:hypothetical protein